MHRIWIEHYRQLRRLSSHTKRTIILKWVSSITISANTKLPNCIFAAGKANTLSIIFLKMRDFVQAKLYAEKMHAFLMKVPEDPGALELPPTAH